jgi:hypothetical protein
MCCLVKAIALHSRRVIYQFVAMDSSGKPKKLGTNSFSAKFLFQRLQEVVRTKLRFYA